MTSTHELNLTRWHKVAERLTAKALEKAEQAAPRPGRELADSGRRGEIASLKAQIHEELGQ